MATARMTVMLAKIKYPSLPKVPASMHVLLIANNAVRILLAFHAEISLYYITSNATLSNKPPKYLIISSSILLRMTIQYLKSLPSLTC